MYVSPGRRIKYQTARSNYPTKYLLLAGTVARKRNAQKIEQKTKQ